MPVSTITVHFDANQQEAAEFAFAVRRDGEHSVTGKGVASLLNDGTLSAWLVDTLYCSQRTESVLLDPFTGRVENVSVYRVEVRLKAQYR